LGRFKFTTGGRGSWRYIDKSASLSGQASDPGLLLNHMTVGGDSQAGIEAEASRATVTYMTRAW